MEDLSSINNKLNQKVGRALVPSILVSLLVLTLIFTSLAFVPLLFLLLVLTASNIATLELHHAFVAAGIKIDKWPLLVGVSAILIATWFGKVNGLAISLAIVLPNVLALMLWRSTENYVRRASAAALIIFYIPFLAGFILLLANNKNGLRWIIALVVIVACSDTFAWVSGVLFGKHKMAPNISPKKTWEGFVGALIFTLIGAGLVFQFPLHRAFWEGAVIGVIGTITSTWGDLIESALKRDMGIKDMGKILPGHGGMLDRMDSILFTAPTIWFAYEALRHFHWL